MRSSIFTLGYCVVLLLTTSTANGQYGPIVGPHHPTHHNPTQPNPHYNPTHHNPTNDYPIPHYPAPPYADWNNDRYSPPYPNQDLRRYGQAVTLYEGSTSIAWNEVQWFRLAQAGYVYSLEFTVEAEGRLDAAAGVWINGQKKGDLFAPGNEDPLLTVTVEAETNAIQLRGYALPNQRGILRVRKVVAYIHQPHRTFVNPQPVRIDFPRRSSCRPCSRLPFETFHYQTQIGAISNRTIILVDRLDGYTDHESYGLYLLPIKKAAAMARAKAEAYGDASMRARRHFRALLRSLNRAEDYLDNMYERSEAFETATDLLGMREYLRDALD